MPPRLDVKPGDKYGRWSVVCEAERNQRGRRFLCRCACGTERVVRLTHLRQGRSKSCGCLCKELSTERATKHGHAGTPLYQVWCDMVRRCTNPKHTRFKDWGGRGITICEEWLNLENFLAWVGTSGYRPGLLIDRIDNDGNYKPSNCRWVTMKEQGNNRRSNRLITYKGKTQTLAQWAELIGIRPTSLSMRLKNGWPLEKALEIPGNYFSKREIANNRKSNKFLEHNGKRMSVADWGRFIGINGSTILNRIENGWSIERALETPVRARRAVVEDGP